LPERLRAGARVLKQHRGHSGIGVWRIELAGRGSDAGLLKVRHAQRGSEQELLDWPALLARLAPYFEPANGGHMIDQPWQPRLVEAMVRAYLVEDRVAGCDFMLGARAAGAAERYVLCEINVSSVAPFPPSAIAPLVAAVQSRLRA
jgi:hypothetical protein